MGIYEQHCEDYAINGNPERDHYDHEDNAIFDCFDGWGDVDPSAALDDDITEWENSDCFGDPIPDDILDDMDADGWDDPVPF
jgi:hypothetical protein